MQADQETTAAKYTSNGKRKFKAKVISLADKSLSVFSRSATTPQTPPSPDALEKLKFRKTKHDFRKKVGEEEKLPFAIPTPGSPTEKPEEKERNLPKPGEEFKPTDRDFRKK